MDTNVFGILNASYTDSGASGVPALTGDDEAVLQPKLKQAEFFSEQNGIEVVTADGASGGKRVGYIDNGDWIKFDPVNLKGVTGIGYRTSSGAGGGTITVHKNAVDGPVVQTVRGAQHRKLGHLRRPASDTGHGPGWLRPAVPGVLRRVRRGQHPGPGHRCGRAGGVPAVDAGRGLPALYDGTGLDGWQQSGPGSFEQQDDCTILSTGGMGLLSFTEEFNAYSLKLDWKVAGDDNSGIFVGYPEPGDDPWVAVNQGYEIQIDATDAPDRTTGSVYSFQSADIPARDGALKPPGEWNSYEIVVQAQTIKVYLNGVLINSFVSTDPARDLTQGFVGIQNHGDGDDVSFRNIQIKEIPDNAAPVTTATFATPGTSGWHPGTVPVQLAATDEGQGVDRIEYKLDSGAWTSYTGTVTVTGDGNHTLLYRAIDKAGNVEAEKAATIKIDGTKPTLMVAGVADGRVYGDATDVVLSWHAEDATSGVASVTGALNGSTIESGGLVALYQMPLGIHRFAVSATDVAGNVTTQTLTFATTTSLRDMGQLLDRFRATNRLSLSAYKALSAQLAKARKAEASGNDAKAVKGAAEVPDTGRVTARVTDRDVRTVLERDALAVLNSIEGGTVLPQAVNGR